MIESKRTLACFALLAGLLACGREAAVTARASGPGPDTGGNAVVAEFEGAKVTREELDARAGSRLAPLRQQEYEIRRQALEDLVHEKLLAREAKARGVTAEALVKKEVDDKAAPPSEGQVQELFERNRGRLGDRTLEQVRPDIERALRDHARAERAQAFRHELLARAGLKVYLDPPRTAVAIPRGTPTLGPESAPVTIVEFADYECPYCQRAQGTVETLLQRNAGKVRFVHRDFPLDGHPHAFPASRAARCAEEQGKFWEYRRALLRPGADLGDEGLRRQAADLGLKADAFASCLASDRHDATIRASLSEGSALGVSATPTFFINGRMVTGARNLDEFQQIVDEELGGRR